MLSFVRNINTLSTIYCYIKGVAESAPRNLHVIAYHSDQNELTQGYFIWEFTRPVETYTIQISPAISVSLDRHFPVLPERINIADDADLEDCKTIAQLFSEDLLLVVSKTRLCGMAIGQFGLYRSQREAIARLQLASPDTPVLLGRAASLLIATRAIRGDGA